jgi:ABC-type phosphate/phosphonate transport system substrate-binding protein
VPGDPALTVAMTDAITSFLEWTLEKDLTPPQRQRLQKALVRYWKSPQERPGFQQILSAEIRRQRADPVDQEASREKLAPQVKANLQKLAKADADVAWLLSLPKGRSRRAIRRSPRASWTS